MNATARATLMLVGRILLVLIFLISGANKAMDVPATAGSIASKGLPYPQVLAALTILLEIGGGLLVIFNRFAVPAAFALAAFCVATAVLFHNFWAFEDAGQYRTQFNHFMKNIAIAGAFLTIAATPSPAKTL
jgi:putative oxidoreductase